MRIIKQEKRIDNHIIEFIKNLKTDNITIYYNYNKNMQSITLYYNTKDKTFFGCSNALENIFTQRQLNIFIKQLENFIKK